MLRLRSADGPFSDATVAGQAARLLALAEALGLWGPKHLVETLDREIFVEALSALCSAGVATSALFEWERQAAKSPEDFAAWLRVLREDLAGSPVPERELPKLAALFGRDQLAKYLGTGGSSLRRYLARQREVPNDVADRAHVLALVTGDLAGSYNERGMRSWFERPRAQLGGRAPGDILSGPWRRGDPDVERVVALAAALAA